MMAAMALGADGVQIGSRFVASVESSAHKAFKKAVLLAKEGDTQLTLKELAPVRLLKNKFYEDINRLYTTTPSKEDLKNLLGKARAKRGMFEGDLEEGELEIGQISGLIDTIASVSDIVNTILKEFDVCKSHISTINITMTNDQ
jgi:enoyl-[acyl-carrier protein] reductase II